MPATDLRRDYLVAFRNFPKPFRNTAILTLSALGLQLLAGMGAVGLALATLTGVPLLAAVLFGATFTGTRLRAFNNIVHECSHNTFTDDREANRIFGSIAASLTLGCFRTYRDAHLTHHAHLGDYAHDRDLQGIRDLELHDPLTPRTVLRHVVTPLIGRHLPYYLHLDLSAADGRRYQAIKLALIGMTLIGLLVAPVFTLMMVVVPYALVYSAINYWTDCLDHAGLIEEADDLHASRNILAPGLLRWIFFPRNDCFHLVHHLFPQVPTGHLQSCHERLLTDGRYASLPNAAKGIGVPIPAKVPLAEA